MLYIDPSLPKIKESFEIHVASLMPLIRQKRDALPPSATEFKTFLNDLRIKKILTDEPAQLLSHHYALLDNLNGFSRDEWEEYLKIKNRPGKNRTASQQTLFLKYFNLVKIVNRVFQYKGGFGKKRTKYSTYNLAANLNLQTCVYCNRIYTKTVINPDKITRPEFDHWFPQESYPILALSFFNLIPSCHVCNSSVKGSKKMVLSDFIHPYVDKNVNFKFSFWIEKYDVYKFRINRISGSKEDNTLKAFQIEKIYETHVDEIHDLVKLKKLYSIKYLLELKKMLLKIDPYISMKEIYRLAFGVHYEEEDFHKRPLSKMKKDILQELNMIID